MFDLLRDIRYDGSEQLSKGASEISQRIHNFITIFRQALKGNPVIKEETINEWKLQLDLGKVNPSEFENWASDSLQKKHKIKVSGSGKNWTIVGNGDDDKMGSSADWISQLLGKAFTINKIKVVQTESLTNNHSNPVTEAAKKKLVDRINSIALKEGISKKEATIKAIKALQESK